MSKKKKKTGNTDDGLSKKRYEKVDKEQSQRFVETAKDLDADKTGEAFDQAFEQIKQDSEKN